MSYSCVWERQGDVSLSVLSIIPENETHSRMTLYLSITTLLYFFSEHHKSKITVWANVLVVSSFLMSLIAGSAFFAIFFGLAAMIIVNFTGCKRVKPCVLMTAAVFCIIASIGAFVFAAVQYDDCYVGEGSSENRCFKHSRAMAIVAGVFWIFAAVATAKIPPYDSTGSSSSPPTFETTAVRKHEQT